jgi:hypothetical protein
MTSIHIGKSKVNAPDNPTWEEAMKGHQTNQAILESYSEKEIQALESKDCWEIINKENWMNMLLRTWAFCFKQFSNVGLHGN